MDRTVRLPRRCVQLIERSQFFRSRQISSILEVSDKIKAFRAKTAIWRRRVQNGITDMFPQLTEFLDTNQIPAEIVKNTIGSHLASLGDYFNDYFTDVDTDAWDWVRDPFVAHTSARGLSGKADEELLDLEGPGR
ncbi:Zinc finger MYM-type protein 6 [Dissostichus eleginoides]|uniref:Zinc finger MYM-type protein 6 n=1 Tax=Dissostichus eleginoides TaxID=100907 RepID=A0AAD9C7X7_DISEL|nr:Zinc finger MYM-type protein 6 [Dissostichus eleginoides]